MGRVQVTRCLKAGEGRGRGGNTEGSGPEWAAKRGEKAKMDRAVFARDGHEGAACASAPKGVRRWPSSCTASGTPTSRGTHKRHTPRRTQARNARKGRRAVSDTPLRTPRGIFKHCWAARGRIWTTRHDTRDRPDLLVRGLLSQNARPAADISEPCPRAVSIGMWVGRPYVQ